MDKKAELLDRIANDFTFHPASPEQQQIYAEIRTKHLELAEYLVNTLPISRELSLALTSLEQSMFNANAAIARNT